MHRHSLLNYNLTHCIAVTYDIEALGKLLLTTVKAINHWLRCCSLWNLLNTCSFVNEIIVNVCIRIIIAWCCSCSSIIGTAINSVWWPSALLFIGITLCITREDNYWINTIFNISFFKLVLSEWSCINLVFCWFWCIRLLLFCWACRY